MVPVAIQVLGEPNKALSSKDELRFGSRGAFAVDKTKGTWVDHADGDAGGGVLDLLKVKKGLEKPAAMEWLREHRHLPPDDRPKSSFNSVAEYDYRDADGGVLFRVVRLDPKDFRQCRPDGNGKWVWKMGGLQLCLYRLPEVIEAVAARRTIYVAEGEKGVLALATLGLDATCSPGGAGKWRQHYSPPLAGADVVILPDNDEPGRKHGEQVLAALYGIARGVRVMPLPGLPDKGDVVDWIAAGGTREALEHLVQGLPMVTRRAAAPKPLTFDNVKGEEAATPEIKTDNVKLEKSDPVATIVAEFNALYMMVNDQGKAVILQPGYDPVLKRRTYDRLAVRDLLTLYMNRLVKVGEKEDGTPILKSAADIWLRHKDRRQYIHGITFDPTTTKAKPGVLNLWEGFAVKPKRGSWAKMRWHIEHILCAGVPEHADYCIKWMARMVQHPAEQGETAVVLKGIEGCGKGFVARALGRIAGQHGIAISNAKHLVGNFNAHLRDSIFLFADEAFFAGDKSHVGVLKSLITEPHLTIEGKGQNIVSAPNFLHVMMASNEAWVVPASMEARRFFVLNVLPDKAGEHAYFTALYAEMEAGGYEAMLHDLLAMDLASFNVRSVPTTEGLQQQRKMSLGTTEAWWLDCLERGYVFRSRLGLEDVFSRWTPGVSTELLMLSYLEFARAHGERHPVRREELGGFFKSVLKAKPARLRNVALGEAMQDEQNFGGGTSRKAKPTIGAHHPCYVVGTLQHARSDFIKHTKLQVLWDAGLTDEQPNSDQPEAANADDPFGSMAAD